MRSYAGGFAALMVFCLAFAVRANGQITIIDEHPRLLIRATPWDGGTSVVQIQARYATDTAFQAQMAPLFSGTQAAYLDEGIKYICTGDTTYATNVINQLLSETGATMPAAWDIYPLWQTEYAIAYDWVYNQCTTAQRTTIESAIASRLNTSLTSYGWKDGATGSLPFWMWWRSPSYAEQLVTQALSLSVTADRQSLLNDAERVYWECLRAHDVSESSPEGKTYFIRNRERSQIYASTSIRSATWNGTVSTLNPYSSSAAVNPHPEYADAVQKSAYWYMYSFRPDGTIERYGDMAAEMTPKYIYQPYIDSVATAYRDPYLNAFSRFLAKWNADRGTEAYSLNYNPGGSVLRERPLMAVWQDPAVPLPAGFDANNPLASLNALPKAAVFGQHSTGDAIIRSGWDANATFISFRAGDRMSHHGHEDAGAFTLFKYDPLAISSGAYGDITYTGATSYSGYYHTSISTNTLRIYNPNEVFHDPLLATATFPNHGGQRQVGLGSTDINSVDEYASKLDSGPHYDTGDIKHFVNDDQKFAYIDSDITKAYNSTIYAEGANVGKVSLVTRQLAYLRQEDVLITFDRVCSTDASFQKSYLLHSWGRPETAGPDTVVQGTLTCGISTASPDADLITMDLSNLDATLGYDTMTRTGRLFAKILLPARHVITKIGGHTGAPYGADDYEFWVDGANRTGIRNVADNPDNQYYDLGQWRAEISPADQQLMDNFLVVMYPRDIYTNAGDLPATSLIDASADGVYGVRVGSQVVLFSSLGNTVSDFSYTFDADSPTGHLLVDLPAGLDLYVFDGLSSRLFTTTADGTLYFDDARTGPHTLTVSVEPVPEPATIVLLGLGGLAAAVRAVRRRKPAGRPGTGPSTCP